MPRLIASLLLLAAVAQAQSLEANLKKKLAKPFLKKAAWMLDYETAKETAQKTGKPIFAYFSRSFAP